MLMPEWTKSSFSFSNGACIEAAWRKSSASTYNGNCAEVGGYRTPSFSHANGNCAEIGAWRKSGASYGGGNCAEAGYGAGVIAVRDTKEAHLGEARTVLEFTPGQWRGLLADITTGRIG